MLANASRAARGVGSDESMTGRFLEASGSFRGMYCLRAPHPRDEGPRPLGTFYAYFPLLNADIASRRLAAE